MIPHHFKQANARLGPPEDLEETQCMTISAFVGQVQGGSVDGSPFTVVAWQPSAEEVKELADGGLIYISMLGGVPPHFLTTNFEQATKPT